MRLVVNGKNIYQLSKNKPVIIPVSENHSQIVATDGFHISRPIQLSYTQPGTFRLQVVCAIDNNLLITGLVLVSIFALVGLISELLILEALSFVPVFYFLFFYYVKRREFIQLKLM